uniref:Putative secreted protein n=1 Tax=Ixodes ricinus TaxID=34613 RepID=A0A6B0U305_IXORI
MPPLFTRMSTLPWICSACSALSGMLVRSAKSSWTTAGACRLEGWAECSSSCLTLSSSPTRRDARMTLQPAA